MCGETGGLVGAVRCGESTLYQLFFHITLLSNLYRVEGQTICTYLGGGLSVR